MLRLNNSCCECNPQICLGLRARRVCAACGQTMAIFHPGPPCPIRFLISQLKTAPRSLPLSISFPSTAKNFQLGEILPFHSKFSHDDDSLSLHSSEILLLGKIDFKWISFLFFFFFFFFTLLFFALCKCNFTFMFITGPHRLTIRFVARVNKVSFGSRRPCRG